MREKARDLAFRYAFMDGYNETKAIAMSTQQQLIEVIDTLSAAEQSSVLRFIEVLREHKETRRAAFQNAVDEFIAEHPELLQRLAQ